MGDGIDYAVARYYPSAMGRFMSPDPLTGDISDPQSLNRYAYVGNNPINFTDPMGLIRTCTGTTGHMTCVDYADDPEPTGSHPGGNVGGGIGFAGPGWGGEMPGPGEPPILGPQPPRSIPAQEKTPMQTSYCSGFVSPVAGNPSVSTEFGAIDKSHPTAHEGRDYAVPIGTTVRAPFDGRVGFAGNAGTFGNLVVIQNPNSNSYLGHLSAMYVRAGAMVQAGDTIGKSGNTGRVFGANGGAHLHFAMTSPGSMFVPQPQTGRQVFPSARVLRPC